MNKIIALTGLVIAISGFSNIVPAASEVYLEAKQSADAAYEAEDFRGAYRKYKDLATYGDSYSQYRMALMNVRGQGTGRDLIEAYAWASLAAEKEHPALEQFREAIWIEMNSKQRHEAGRKAEKYMDRYGRLALAKKARRAAKRELRSCTGSRLGSSCGRVYSASAPRGGAISPGGGPFSGAAGGRANFRQVTGLTTGNPQRSDAIASDSGNAGGISNSNQGDTLGPATRDPEYYDRLRTSIDTLEQMIADYDGRVELKELELLDDEEGNGEDSATASEQ